MATIPEFRFRMLGCPQVYHMRNRINLVARGRYACHIGRAEMSVSAAVSHQEAHFCQYTAIFKLVCVYVGSPSWLLQITVRRK